MLHGILGNIFCSIITVWSPDIYSEQGCILHHGFQITKFQTFGPMLCWKSLPLIADQHGIIPNIYLKWQFILHNAVSSCEALNFTSQQSCIRNNMCFTEGCPKTPGELRRREATSRLSITCPNFILLVESPCYSWTLKPYANWPPLTNHILERQKFY